MATSKNFTCITDNLDVCLLTVHNSVKIYGTPKKYLFTHTHTVPVNSVSFLCWLDDDCISLSLHLYFEH